MKSRELKVVAVVALVASVMVILSPGIIRSADPQPAEAGPGPLLLSLAQPAFAETAGSSFPANEVGISAYVNVGATVDLAKARAQLSSPEDVADTYVIGTPLLDASSEDMAPHVYISSDGWLMAYYPKSEPSSKLIQWYGYKRDAISTTTLLDALITLARGLGFDGSRIADDIKYFHFQYPDATKLLIAADTVADGDDEFRYTIPSGINLYDASWSHFGSAVSYNSESKIDGTSVLSAGSGTYVYCKTIEGQFLTTKTAHTVTLHERSTGWAGFAVLFLYR